MDLARHHSTPGLAIYETIMDTDRPARRANQERLRALKRDHGGEITIFCSHDTQELAALQGEARGRSRFSAPASTRNASAAELALPLKTPN
jgi:hypothetical protein